MRQIVSYQVVVPSQRCFLLHWGLRSKCADILGQLYVSVWKLALSWVIVFTLKFWEHAHVHLVGGLLLVIHQGRLILRVWKTLGTELNALFLHTIYAPVLEAVFKINLGIVRHGLPHFVLLPLRPRVWLVKEAKLLHYLVDLAWIHAIKFRLE